MITELTNEHIYQIIRFIKECDSLFPVPISQKADISEYVGKVLNNGVVFAFMDDGEIAGILFGYANNTESYTAYISLLCVKPEYQGKGIAKKLINRFKDYCCEAKMKRITLYTHNKNTVAIKLYEKYGFIRSESGRADNCFFVFDLKGEDERC